MDTILKLALAIIIVVLVVVLLLVGYVLLKLLTEMAEGIRFEHGARFRRGEHVGISRTCRDLPDPDV